MAIDRTTFAVVDDDGTEETGTEFNAAWVDALADAIDAYAALLGPSEDIPFFNMAGPTAERTFTFPDADATVLTDLSSTLGGDAGTGTVIRNGAQAFADTAVVDLGSATTHHGFLAVGYDSGIWGLFVQQGSAGVGIVSDTASHYSITKNTANRINVYIESGNLKIQNLRGSSVQLRIVRIGA